MKTKYLDKEIQLLNSIKRNNEISDYGQEKLNERIALDCTMKPCKHPKYYNK